VRNGWEVHAIDFSEEGMRKTRRLAEEHGVTVEYTVADLESFVPEHQAYDMAALVFVHLSALLRRTLHHRCAEALRPGGCMLIEAFSPDQLAYGSGGPRHKELLYTTDMLAADFPSLEITLLEECIVNLREGPFHDGEAAVVRLIAEKPSDM
jgi:2-polyprenyl-3-methyl-5-hydroxy-6-metoxy-1,4-benzoquinol methylase